MGAGPVRDKPAMARTMENISSIAPPDPLPRTARGETGRVGRRSSGWPGMRPTDLQPIGSELAIRWADGRESFVPLETLRKFCPCAGCLGEKDIFGNVYKAPERPYGPGAFELRELRPVGGYAVQPVWADGHATGLYTWEWLERLASAGAGGPVPAE